MKDKIKNPVGRPAMKPDDKRKPRSIKMTDDEWRQLQKLAEEEEKSVAEYIRKKTIAGE